MSDFFDEIEDPFGTLGSRLVNLGNYRNKKKSNFPIKDRYLGKVIKYHREYPIKNHFMYEEFSKHNDPSEVSPSYKIVVKELDDHKYFGSFYDLGPQNISSLTGDISQYDEFVVNPKMNFSHNQTLAFFPGDLVYVSYALKEQRMGPYIIESAGDYVPNIDLTGLSGEEIQELAPELVMVTEEPLMSSPESLYTSEYKFVYPRRLSLRTSTGLPNQPDNTEEDNNLVYLEEEVIPEILPVLKSLNPSFTVTSVYRSDEVNERVGGNKGSYHKTGLAFDVGGISSLSKSERDQEFIRAANYLKTNSSDFPWLRMVLIELWRNHLHIESFKKGEVGTAKFRMWETQESGIKNF